MHYLVWQIINYPVLLRWQLTKLFIKVDFSILRANIKGKVNRQKTAFNEGFISER